MILPRSTFTSKRPSLPSAQSCQVTMRLSLLMAKLAPARLLQWKDSSMVKSKNREELSLDRWKRYSLTLGLNKLSKAPLWLEPVTSRSTTRPSVTCWRPSAPVCRFERMPKGVFLLRAYQSGPCVPQARPTTWWFEASRPDRRPPLKWMMSAVVHMPSSLSL